MSTAIPAFIAKLSVRRECQERSIVATVCGLALLIAALIMGAREMFILCGITATLAGGFIGAALMAMRLERRFRD